MLNQEELDDFVIGQKAKTTKYKDRSDLNIFQRFCVKVNETREIHEIPTHELDILLSNFFVKATKQRGGGLYEPDTLSSVRNSLQRVLISRGVKIDLRKDKEFEKSRNVLSARRKQLTKLGKGNKPNACRALEQEEVTHLAKIGYFGRKHPLNLQRAVWYVITINFGHRARQEARSLQYGDIKVGATKNGRRMLIWDTERGTKTRTGETPMGHQRPYNPTAVEKGGPMCPVGLFEEFKKHRPTTMNEAESPLFLAVRYHINDYEKVLEWYFPSALGKNILGKFLPEARDALNASGLTTSKGKVANHSARKTSISTLLGNNVNPLIVQQHSGHKRLESLNAYNTPTSAQQEEISDIVNGVQPRPITIAPKQQQPVSAALSDTYEMNMAFTQNYIANLLSHPGFVPRFSLMPPSLTDTTPKPHQISPHNLQPQVYNNCTFNIGSNSPVPTKRRRVVIESDSEDEI